MSLFALFAILITVTALLSYLNERRLGLPPTIGVMASALVLSILLLVAGKLGFGVGDWAESLLRDVDFGAVLMQGMLSFLLFAGALHVNLEDLLARKGPILTLATFGVALSTLLLGSVAWGLFRLFGLEVSFVHALLFGALISPTDPIAVLGVLKTANTPRKLKAMITGESLLNDGVGVVVFLLLMGMVTAAHEVTIAGAAELFLIEAVGGLLYGVVLGYVTYRLLRNVDQYTVEILLTLALVAGGYALASAIHVSGPIAMVAAGLFIGNHGRVFGMSESTREHLDTFWELLDEILNSILFVLIGLELLILDLEPVYLLIGVLAIPAVLLVRFIVVGLPISVFRRFTSYVPYTVTMMTWCGVRGGISIALALSLPKSAPRDLILVVTYVIVVFSILVQGLTAGRLARWTAARS